MLDNLLQAAEHLVGFVIVLLALSLLWGSTALVGRFFQAFVSPTIPKVAAAQAANPPPVPGESPIPEEEVAVVAAATAFLLDGHHRIVSIRTAASRWGVQGRSDLHASHRLRR